MKKIEVIIRPGLLERVREALIAESNKGLTITECRGNGHSTHLMDNGDLQPRVLIELVVPDCKSSSTIATITAAVRTGAHVDGIIFVSSISGALHVRTGNLDDDAIA